MHIRNNWTFNCLKYDAQITILFPNKEQLRQACIGPIEN